MRIVVLAPSGGFAGSVLPGLPSDAVVSVVALPGTTNEGAEVVQVSLPAGVGERITRVAARSVPGRVLLRLTPLDPGVRYWRSAMKSERARALLARADIVIASERDAGYAAWRWTRAMRRTRPERVAVFGYPAGRAAIERIAS